MSELTLRDFDTCACGDYRKDHKDGLGACIHNKPRDMTHGYQDCNKFRLSRAATGIPEPYRRALPNSSGGTIG